jgi:hypothetical protein
MPSEGSPDHGSHRTLGYCRSRRFTSLAIWSAWGTAVGSAAIGALAVGAAVVGRLKVGKAEAKRLPVGRLEVGAPLIGGRPVSAQDIAPSTGSS